MTTEQSRCFSMFWGPCCLISMSPTLGSSLGLLYRQAWFVIICITKSFISCSELTLLFFPCKMVMLIFPQQKLTCLFLTLLRQVTEWILSHEWTVGELWNVLVDYSAQRLKGETDLGFFSWLLPSLSSTSDAMMLDVPQTP